MATAYELVADTRPWIRGDVLFTRSASGVLFHDANDGFNLSGGTAYRLAGLIVPHLDGTNRVADLCAGLEPQQREMVSELVRMLYERGFARDVGPGDDTGALIGRFRGVRVAVVGDGSVARSCVLGLIRNGAGKVAVLPAIRAPHNRFDEELSEAGAPAGDDGRPCEITELADGDGPLGWEQLASFDMVLVTGTADAPRRILPLLKAGIPQGRKLLAAWMYGTSAVIGPFMESGRPGCWACAALRLGANGDPSQAADLWSDIALNGVGDPAAPLSGPLAGMVGNLLGYEVFRHVTQALAAEAAGAVVIQDLESPGARSEPLLPHPACPFCAAAALETQSPHAISVWDLGAARRERGEDEDLLDDPADVLAELESRSVLVQPHVGVFTAFEGETWSQIPLKIGTVRFGVGHRGRRAVSAFDVHHVAAARIRALYTAAEVYADHVIPVGAVLSGDELERAGLRWPKISPDRLGIAGSVVARVDQVPHWALATRLGTTETVLVPAAALRTFGPYNHERTVLATSAGTGAGSSPGHAVARGLRSALGLDALVRVPRETGAVATVPLDALGADPELAFLAKSVRNLDADVELLDLGDPASRPAPVLLARVRGTAETPGDWAVGCAPAWQEAAVAALRDLLGRIQLARRLGPDAVVDYGDALLGDFDADVLAPTAESEPRLDAVTVWDEVVGRLRAGGGDVLVAPIAAPDLAAGGISVARVLLARTDAESR